VGAGAADLAGLVSAFHGGLIEKRSQRVVSEGAGVKPKGALNEISTGSGPGISLPAALP
jgi:hypothetical protein